MTKHEPTVPLSELGLERMTSAELAAYANLADVTVLTDYLDRPAISLSDAYSIAEQRRRAEAEYRAAESRQRTEHAAAVKDLQQRVNDEFNQARKTFALEHAGQPWFGGGDEAAGAAVNHGLTMARLIWSAAGAAVRDQVTSVEFDEAGTHHVIPLHVGLSLDLISSYAAKAARKY